LYSKNYLSECDEQINSQNKISEQILENIAELDKINEEKSVSEESYQHQDPSPKVQVRIKDTWQESERDDSQILGKLTKLLNSLRIS
jgi:hypothetical protein